MNICILHGSPRPKGDSAFLLSIAKEEMKNHKDIEIKEFNMFKEKANPCIDCRYCYKNDHCFIEDSMTELLPFLLKADKIIIGSPIYFNTLPGMFLNFISRLQYIFVQSAIRKKPLDIPKKEGLILLTGGGTGSPKGAIKTSKIFLGEINGKSIGEVLSFDTDKVPAYKDEEAIKNTKILTKKLLETRRQQE